MKLNSPARHPRIITPEEALAALGPDILRKFYDACQRAWARYRAEIAPSLAKPPARFRANAVHALLIAELEKEFGGQVKYWHGRALFCLVPGIVLQVKKLDDRGLPQNYPTPTAERFASQVEIEGLPSDTRLTIGYMLNEIGTEITGVRLLQQLGQRVAWYRSIVVNQDVMPFFTNTTTVTSSTPNRTRKKLQAKNAAKAKTKKKPGI